MPEPGNPSHWRTYTEFCADSECRDCVPYHDYERNTYDMRDYGTCWPCPGNGMFCSYKRVDCDTSSPGIITIDESQGKSNNYFLHFLHFFVLSNV